MPRSNKTLPTNKPLPTNKLCKGNVRITGGKWCRRKITFIGNQTLRPTSDRVRETLFNWLAPYIHNYYCLDLFAGSGILSLEALSRGAAHATLIENNHASFQQLLKTKQLLALNNSEVIKRDTLNWLQNAQRDHKIDLVFLDPPFDAPHHFLANIYLLLEANKLLEKNAFIYVESSRFGDEAEIPEAWSLYRSKYFGAVHARLFTTH